MFLDEELEAIHTTNGFKPETSFMLFDACRKRIPEPGQVSTKDYLNEIRKIEGGWKLFCKRHPQYRPEGFREVILKKCGEIMNEPVLKYLHWD